MFRAEQLDRASKGLRLMPDELTTPVMQGLTPSGGQACGLPTLRLPCF
jgi:hypothetical protein